MCTCHAVKCRHVPVKACTYQFAGATMFHIEREMQVVVSQCGLRVKVISNCPLGDKKQP